MLRARAVLIVVTVGLVAAGVVDSANAAPPPTPARLRDCRNHPPAECGFVTVPLDRLDPTVGTIDVGFEYYPHSGPGPSLGTIVPVEGGPGYATRQSRFWYLDLYRPLMDRWDLLMVDNRGTGTSGVVDCPYLQSYRHDYVLNAGRCGRSLGDAADLYGSGNAADDLADVLDALHIDVIDLYGDSYGTFFSQTFAVRHPDRLRSVVLDSAYWVEWTDPWYSDTNRAYRDAFAYVCQRRPSCATRPGGPMDRIDALLDRVRDKPLTGIAPDADGVEHRITLDAGIVATMVVAAATSPTIYRDMDAAIRAALRPDDPDPAPLLRLAAESIYWGDAGPVQEYSEGLYLAVACNDYPQAYDMTSPIEDRPAQYEASIQDVKDTDPGLFAPFTVDEWVTAPVEYWDSCLDWPVPSRVDPPVPPGATYPEVPVLVLSGDLDSLTSPEGAMATANAFPNATFVSVANGTHVEALSDYNRCASVIVRRFVETLSPGDTSCAADYAEIRAVDTFPRRAAELGNVSDARRTALVAANTVADVVARWWNMYGFHGVGLRGGTWTTFGYDKVGFNLHDVAWVEDSTVDGTVIWDRASGRISADVSVSGSGVVGGCCTWRGATGTSSRWARRPGRSAVSR